MILCSFSGPCEKKSYCPLQVKVYGIFYTPHRSSPGRFPGKVGVNKKLKMKMIYSREERKIYKKKPVKKSVKPCMKEQKLRSGKIVKRS